MQQLAPVTKQVRWQRKLDHLKVGGYADFPFDISHTSAMRRYVNRIHLGWEITAKTLEDGRGIRVWRTK